MTSARLTKKASQVKHRINGNGNVKHENRMKILLTAWAARHFKPVPTENTLRAWARSKLIYPAPEKIGRTWMVEEDAEYFRPTTTTEMRTEGMSKRALEILNGTKAA